MKDKLNVIDFQHIYYKYKNMVDMGRMKALTDENGNNISVKYYVLKEIERISERGMVDTVICFESRHNRHKEDNEDYKAKRVKTLGESDFSCISEIADILDKCGYKVLKVDGYEADDLVASVVTYHDSGEGTGKYKEIDVYTIDNDMLQLIEGTINIMMYRMGKGYVKINTENFDEVSSMLKAEVPFNTVMIYKATVGDKSDNIMGVKGFGVAAYERLIDWLKSVNGKFELMNKEEIVQSVLSVYFEKVMSDTTKKEQALDSLKLVTMDRHIKGIDYNIESVDIANKNMVYNNLGMNSLVK